MKNTRISDLFVYLRILLVFIFSLILTFDIKFFGLILGSIIIAVIFFTDVLDGIIARRFDAESKFGGMMDILGDRIAEIVLLIPFVFENIIHPALLIFFVVKGFLVDFIRFRKFHSSEKAPFDQSKSGFFVLLVKGRPMRALYGASKLIMFFVFYLYVFEPSEVVKNLSLFFYWMTLILAILRSAPVFTEELKLKN
jgi:CDP-diacylglycerol--glycerol-3-phosphate 3-phosphatidyltransferase